mmetsp:Transcript_46201/g.75382  ORF Transcript_46201/g.75382 Transcript_46201/m.75382 type:complete len:83 (-) Transcript_46201:306-554(-)
MYFLCVMQDGEGNLSALPQSLGTALFVEKPSSVCLECCERIDQLSTVHLPTNPQKKMILLYFDHYPHPSYYASDEKIHDNLR